jgi:hypothetical protein
MQRGRGAIPGTNRLGLETAPRRSQRQKVKEDGVGNDRVRKKKEVDGEGHLDHSCAEVEDNHPECLPETRERVDSQNDTDK